jgi:hypothetical protein
VRDRIQGVKKAKVTKVRAEWSQLRYLLAVPLLAFNDPDLHNWSTKGWLTLKNAPSV